MDEIAPEFDDCGSFCSQEGKFKKGFCAGCPSKQAKDAFKKAVSEEANANPRIVNFDFDNVYENLLGIIGLDLPSEKITYRTGLLLDAWKAEKIKFDRINEYNRRSNSK